MKVGIDIHGVLDHHPEKYIQLARQLMYAGSEVHILTGPPVERAVDELYDLMKKYNRGERFWDDIHSIVDYVRVHNIPHHYVDEKHLWTDNKEDWDKIKGTIAKKIGLDLHFDDSKEYEPYFPPGVFCYVERRKSN